MAIESMIKSVSCKSVHFMDSDPEMLNAETHIIEARTKEEIEIILEETGIKRGSQDWRDYSRAKKILFKGLWIDSEIYDRQIQWICDYLSL